MKHLFIINPAAGVKDSSNKISEEVKKIYHKGECDIHITTSPNDATSFVSSYLDNHKDETVRIYACGGDGTLNEVVNGAYSHKNAEVTCYPNGSGNDFLKYFGDVSSFLDIDSLSRGTIVNVDLIKLNDKFILNVFNVGVDSNVVVKQRRIKRYPLVSGKMAYTLGLVGAFFGKISSVYKITVDDKKVYDGKGILCAVANSICYGGGYYCAPEAKIDDGLLDVCFVKKISKLRFLGLVGDYKKGKHLEKPKVRKHVVYEKGKKVRIELDKEWPASVDGEIVYVKDITLEVVPKAIKFVIPQKIDNN